MVSEIIRSQERTILLVVVMPEIRRKPTNVVIMLKEDKVLLDKDLDLAELLQASPPLVATRTFDRARKLLSLCNQSASATGTPVQKIVYYFADALQHRIDKRDEENAIYWRGRY
ncbi:uncharacterized protein [Solanum lycopersicum]|uniref:uncharacterized protein n=1 Tax=Solanum lycopersicum TaxID=4081 RepID=UPI000532C2A5